MRRPPYESVQRVWDGAFFILLGLVCLGVWAWRQRAVASPEAPVASALSFQPGRPVLWLALAYGAGLGAQTLGRFAAADWAWLADWVALAGLGTFVMAGLPAGVLRQTVRPAWNRTRRQTAGAVLCLVLLALFPRLLFAGVAEPAWPVLSQGQTLTGALYRVLGDARAVLLPFALSCLLPVAAWQASRLLARDAIALGAGLLACLSPYLIWSDLYAGAGGLAPMACLAFLASGLSAWRTHRPGAWLWMGLAFGILWMESAPFRPLWTIWGLGTAVCLAWLSASGGRWGLTHGLGFLAGLGAGPTLFATSMTGWAELAIWHWAFPFWPDGTRLLSAWFQPLALALPWRITLLLPVDGLLALVGLTVVLFAGRREPILALAAVMWLAGMLWLSRAPEALNAWAYATAATPFLLAARGLVPIAQSARTWREKWDLPAFRGRLPLALGLLAACQLPGGVLGRNVLVAFAEQWRGTETLAAGRPAEVPPVILYPDVEAAPAWTAALVWRRGGTCQASQELPTVPRGIALDLASRAVWVTGTEPSAALVLSLDEGRLQRRIPAESVREPAEIALTEGGAALVLDALSGTVWELRPEAAHFAALTSGAELYRPRGFARAADGSLLVADTGRNRIVHFRADGSYAHDYAAWPGARNLDQPTDVWALRDRVWVASPEGPFLRELQSNVQLAVISPGYTQFGPHLAGLPDGTFWVTDPEAGRILYLDRDGALLARVAIPPRPTVLDAARDADGLLLALVDSAACQVSLLRVAEP